jgi:membrane protein
VPGGAFVDAMAILKVLHGGAQLSGTALVSSAAIRAHTRIGYDEMTTLLDQMVAAGWVGRVQNETAARVRWGANVRESFDNWVLLVDTGTIRLSDVYRMFVFGGAGTEVVATGETVAAAALASPLALDTAALTRRVEAAVEQGLDQTLAEHFAGK